MTEQDETPDRIEAALRDLGARLAVPPPPKAAELTEAVLARLAGPARRAHRSRPRLVRVAAGVVVLLLAFALLVAVSPPVRAGVVNLLRFAGIELRTESAPGTLPLVPRPLPSERTVGLADARAEASFPIMVPDMLGTPERVTLIDGDPPRVVSLSYRGGTIRLDEFHGDLTPAFGKLVGYDGVSRVSVDGHPGIWMAVPHELFYIDRDGQWQRESARLSAATLAWQVGTTTLRLEGEFTLEQALTIARSVR